MTARERYAVLFQEVAIAIQEGYADELFWKGIEQTLLVIFREEQPIHFICPNVFTTTAEFERCMDAPGVPN